MSNSSWQETLRRQSEGTVSQTVAVSVIVPVFNEADNVESLWHEISTSLTRTKHTFEVIFADDASTDGTSERLAGLNAGPCLHIVRHRCNCGQSAAVATGFRHAQGCFVATLDGDRQNDPGDLPRLIEHLLAVHACGYELIDTMIVQELFGQATGAHKSASPGQNLPKPVMYFFWRFLPFSVFAFVGLWRTVRRPAASGDERRFERFLTCWILTGLAVFSLAVHHRADLLLPLWPAGALLAGREVARLREVVGERLVGWSTAAVCAVLVLSAYWTYHVMPARRARVADYSAQVRQAAEALKAADINPDELIHVSTPVTLQMYLGTCKSWVDLDEVQELLARGQSLLLAIGDNKYRNNLLDALTDAFVEELCIWPQDSAHEQGFRLTILQVVPQ